MSNSSQEFSFGGSPPRACPGTAGESPSQEGNSPEQPSTDSYEEVNIGPAQVVKEVPTTSSRSASSSSAAGRGGDRHDQCSVSADNSAATNVSDADKHGHVSMCQSSVQVDVDSVATNVADTDKPFHVVSEAKSKSHEKSTAPPVGTDNLSGMPKREAQKYCEDVGNAAATYVADADKLSHGVAICGPEVVLFLATIVIFFGM